MSQYPPTRPFWSRESSPSRRRRPGGVATPPRPGNGGGGRRRSSRSRRIWLRVVCVALAVISLLGIVGVAVAFAEYESLRDQLPDTAAIANMEPASDSYVYARDGKTLLAVLHTPDYRHQHVALKDVSKWAKEATVDVEDRHFYENNGWDLGRIIAAAWSNVRHEGTTQGASTITEQLAKVSFLCTGSSCQRSYERKIKQFILGADIESNFSKDQILEMYLNRISFGNHAIGIETAAQLYFHKPARDLDLAEASMLAGIPNAPSVFNPLNHPDGVDVNQAAKDRQQVVLDAMVRNGDITEDQAVNAYAEPLTYHPFYESEPIVFPNFVDYLRLYLQDTLLPQLSERYGDQAATLLQQGGLTIVSSIDPVRQKQAEQIVHDGISQILSKNAHDGALVSMDPRSGEILAMVGTANADDPVIGPYNQAITPLQPGSTIKLFTYTTAIGSRQFTMTSPIADTPVTLRDGSAAGYSPQNYDKRFHGTCLLEVCLGNSFNIPAVKVEAAVGIPEITDVEIATGLKSLSDPGDPAHGIPSNRPARTQYAATLGGLTRGISPLELIDGASTIADMGVHHDPAPVLQVINRATGQTLYSHDAKLTGRQVVPAGVAFIMNEITSNDRNRLVEFGPHGDLTLPDRRVSAKTGTTEFFSDNWTVGWTPQVATVVWVGNKDHSCLKPSDDGALRAAIARGHTLPFYGSDQTDAEPYSPDELIQYGLSPRSTSCGHLIGSTGITGAAPIWNAYMRKALDGVPKDWYAKPPEVVQSGSGDDANFYLPGTAPAGVSNEGSASPSGGYCYYYGPTPSPTNRCQYLGTSRPSSSPQPGTSPAPTAAPATTPVPIPSLAPAPTEASPPTHAAPSPATP